MAGLSKLILPSSALDADDVVENFNALKDVVNDLKDHNFEPGALNTRHFLEKALSSPALPFKKTYRNTFTATAIDNSAYAEVVRLVTAGTGSHPETHKEDSIVFVIAELEVYHDNAKTSVIGSAADDVYGFRLERSQGIGTGTSWGSFSNETQRYVTPGSAETSPEKVYAEIAEVVLFGFFQIVSDSATFEARVMAKSIGQDGSGNYDLTTNGSADGKVEGAITALVIAR
jgi:hypothetical protein